MSVTEQLSGLRDRLEQTEKMLRAILEGQKPYLDPNGPQGWLFEQLTRMHAGFFIPESAESYVMLPGEGVRERGLKGDMRFHPLAYKLVLRQKSLEQRLHNEGIKNFKVLGVDYALRDTARNPADQMTQAGALILSRGDLYSLWQFSAILKERLQGGRSDIPLILQNTAQGFWNPAIGGLGLDILSGETGKGFNVHFSDGPHDTLEILRSHGRNSGSDPQIDPALRIEPGATILVVTRNSKKVHELQSILDTQKANVRVLPFCNLFPKPMEAKETSRSYAGNNMEKVAKAWERLDEMGADAVEEILRNKKGMDPQKTYLWFDDRGLEFTEPFLDHPLFDECRSYLNPYKLMPGAEMAHVNKSMSLEDFYARIEMSLSDMETKRRAGGLPGAVDRTAYDRTNYIITSLMPGQNGKRGVYSFTAATNDLLSECPRPAQDIYKYSEHYQVPKNMPGGRTKAEISDYIETMSSMALAAKAAMFTLGMEDHAARAQARMRAKFHDAARSGRWKIGTQHSLRADTYGHGKASKGIINRLEGAYKFLEGNGGQYDPRIPRLHDIYDDKGNRVQIASSLNNFYRFASDANAFMLTSEERREDCEKFFAVRLFAFFSLVVGKQVFDPAIAGSPFIVLNRAQERSWDDCLSIYTHLHRNGFLGDKPHHIFKLCRTREDAEKALQKMMENYIPNNLPQSRFWEKGRKSPDDLFRVTVYCSATSTNNRLRQNARDFSFELARSGCSIRNGGGMDGLMYETSMGVHDFRRWWAEKHDGQPMPRNHVSSIQCEDTYQSEGLCDFNDYVCVHPNIFLRMDDLQTTDAEVFLPGGAGTVQELIASFLMREAGLIPANRPVIIVNAEIGHGRHRTRVYEPLVEAIPEHYFEKYNIRVVDDEKAALQLVREYQAASGKYVPPAPGWRSVFPEPFPPQ